MPPKTRVSKDDWDYCDICGVHMPAVAKHAFHCHGNEKQINSMTTPNDRANNYNKSPVTQTPKKSTDRGSSVGFVRDGILHGIAIERHIKSDELSRLPPSAVDDVVILCPSTMSMCHMSIGRPVLVWCGPARFAVHMAWPSWKTVSCLTDVSLSPRTMSALSCDNGSLVHVENYEPKHMSPASEIFLETSIEKSFLGTKEFADSFRYMFHGKHMIDGARLFTHFYGRRCELTVSKVVGDIKCRSPPEETSLSQIRKDLQTLCMTSDDASSPSKDSLTTFVASSMCDCHESRPSTASIDSCFYVQSSTKVRVTDGQGDELVDEEASSGVCRQSKETVVTFDDIGGLDRQINEIRQFLTLSESEVQTFVSYGLRPPKGILLYGSNGTGKTLIGRALAYEMKNRFLSIDGPEVYSKFLGETESRLRELFVEAIERAPSVIFIDEIDSLCSRRGNSTTSQEQRVVATLSTLMDNLPMSFNERVIVVAATNKLDNLDPSMRRPGRFDREIEIGIPTVTDRVQARFVKILKKLLRGVRHNMTMDDIEKVAAMTHGYVGADLNALCSQAGLCAMSRVERFASSNDPCEQVVTVDDVLLATDKIKPSALREVLIEVPKVRWTDVGGQEDLKRKLKQAVEWPLKHPEAFERMGITPPKGVLMYGPPGCSKTMIAKAVATESGLNFIAIKGPELFSKWVGESEKAIREVFRKARSASPCVVFFDEIDALASERGSSSGGSQVGDRVLAQLLSEMDGLEQLRGVFTLAATNRPDMIDKALLRPGRLDRIVYVPLPDDETRREIFTIQFQRMPVADDVDLERLVHKTDRYSGAEVVAVCQEAALKALDENLNAPQILARHFDDALAIVRPRITDQMIRFYEDYKTRGQGKNVQASSSGL